MRKFMGFDKRHACKRCLNKLKTIEVRFREIDEE